MKQRVLLIVAHCFIVHMKPILVQRASSLFDANIPQRHSCFPKYKIKKQEKVNENEGMTSLLHHRRRHRHHSYTQIDIYR